jgi:hypothetical protein
MNNLIIRTLIDAINAYMTSSLPDAFYELVFRRLETFGYDVTEADAFGIAFSVQKSELNIRNDCNITKIPEALFPTLCDMSCGDFLAVKYQTGKLNLSDLDLDGAIASVSEGDVSISFDKSTTSEGKFAVLLSALSDAGRGNLECYRKIGW